MHNWVLDMTLAMNVATSKRLSVGTTFFTEVSHISVAMINQQTVAHGKAEKV